MEEIINKVCAQLPAGWLIELCMDKGSAWVELSDPVATNQELPDPAGETIIEQLEDALCVAKERARV